MFERTGALVLGLYLLVATAVAVVGYSAFRYYRTASLELAGLETENGSGRPGGAYKATRRAATNPYNVTALLRANERLQQLQAALGKKSEMLEQRTARLEEKTAECNLLQAELDKSIALAFEMLDANTGDRTPADEKARADLKAELDRLQLELDKSAALRRTQTEQVAQLQDELMQADFEIAGLRNQADREIVTIIAQAQNVESAATEVLVDLGPMAVPLLVGLLNDELPVVRRWAVRVLGEMGPNAREATAAIRGLQTDPDEDVRRQAQRALLAIAP